MREGPGRGNKGAELIQVLLQCVQALIDILLSEGLGKCHVFFFIGV